MSAGRWFLVGVIVVAPVFAAIRAGAIAQPPSAPVAPLAPAPQALQAPQAPPSF